MNKEQYERWKDFARRMVNVAVSSRKRAPSRATVLENIEFFFECRMDPNEEWQRVKDWDNTEKKSEENRHPMCVGDHLSDLAEYFIPNYWSLTERGYEKAEEQWMTAVHCCVRAGLDLASAPSGGVVGFTAGDIRKMYPEGVPSWITEHFKKFEKIKDHKPLWL